MFADISGFNDMAHSKAMEEVILVHTVFVTMMEEVGKGTKGTVLSLVGDRVILAWNAVTSVGPHASQVCLGLSESADFLPTFSLRFLY